MNTKLIAIVILALLISSAAAQTPMTENTKLDAARTRIPGELYSVGKVLSGAISAPASVAAEKDFQVTITTSGNGCVRRGRRGCDPVRGQRGYFCL